MRILAPYITCVITSAASPTKGKTKNGRANMKQQEQPGPRR